LALPKSSEIPVATTNRFGEVRSVLENDMFIDLDDDDFNG
jgi:hypothetical protein